MPNQPIKKTDIIKSKGSLVEPIVSKLGPALSAIPGLLLPSPKGGTATKPNNTPHRRTVWPWLVLGILLIAVAGTSWYFLRDGEIPSETETIESRSTRLLYRSSTFPSANLTLSGVATKLSIANLDPLPEGKEYKLVLLSSNGADPVVPDLTSPNVQDLGSFTVGEDGQLLQGETDANFETVNLSLADQAMILVGQGAQMSVLLAGNITAPENGQSSAELAFPIDLIKASGNLVVNAQEDQATLVIDFSSLPSLNTLGLKYEARLVNFVGPTVGGETLLGGFDGNTTANTTVTFSTSGITDYSDLIISLKPSWDTGTEIGQIKPFTAVLN